jgi:CRISPR-associated protein Csm5
MQYKLTALTPLLVGDGRELSPIDYMVWKDQVNVLDQARIFRLLARGPRLEGYLTQLRKATKLDFASWGGFAQNFSQRRIPFENSGATAIWNAAPTESLFIPTFASDYRGAYLPGSSIKGALRTGLLYSRFSPAAIDRLAASLEGDRVPRRITESTENSLGASQVKIVSVADSAPATGASFKIYVTRAASLDTRQGGSPQLAWKVAGRGSVPASRVGDSTAIFAEMAAPGAMFSGGWQDRQFLENPELARALGWRSAPSVKAILDAANDYAEAQLALHARYAELSGLAALAETVGRLQQELAAVRGQSLSCLLCLGWGGGFLSKSAALDTESQALRKILRTVPAIGRSMRDGVIFPKTRRIVFVGGQPSSLPGWARLQFS